VLSESKVQRKSRTLSECSDHNTAVSSAPKPQEPSAMQQGWPVSGRSVEILTHTYTQQNANELAAQS